MSALSCTLTSHAVCSMWATVPSLATSASLSLHPAQHHPLAPLPACLLAPPPQDLPQDAPVLILFPGLTGGSGDSYVQHAVLQARHAGVRAAVFNSRGTADSPVLTPQFYSASFTDDTREVWHAWQHTPAARPTRSFAPNKKTGCWPIVCRPARFASLHAHPPTPTPTLTLTPIVTLLLQVIAHVRQAYPSSTLFAAGWSLGANILVNYLGEQVGVCGDT